MLSPGGSADRARLRATAFRGAGRREHTGEISAGLLAERDDRDARKTLIGPYVDYFADYA